MQPLKISLVYLCFSKVALRLLKEEFYRSCFRGYVWIPKTNDSVRTTSYLNKTKEEILSIVFILHNTLLHVSLINN